MITRRGSVVLAVVVMVGCVSVATPGGASETSHLENTSEGSRIFEAATVTPTLTTTPTQAPTQTATATPLTAIVEITPTGGLYGAGPVFDILGQYRPFNRLNIRECSGTDCRVLGLLAAGEWVDVFAMVVSGGDVWLCLDVSYTQDGKFIGTQCGAVVVYQFDGHIYGELILR